EVKIIEMKFLSNKKLKDDFIYNQLLIKKDSFYEKKKNAIRLIATALGIISKADIINFDNHLNEQS
ncbi:hypothetical protein COA14_31035, partial [Bacillus cereus]